MAFIVIDTEGADRLREIAVFDERGTLLYEAFVQGHPNNDRARFRVEPLPQILQRFVELAHNQQVVCHFAEHDQKILKASFRQAFFPWQAIKFECTWQLAQQYFPGLPSYSLEYLSRYLTLRVNGRYFNPHAAHSARYDAEFTHQLYLKIMDAQARQTLQNQPNPFSSRVDTPFQQHPDYQPIYQDEFSLLKSVIMEIRQDHNHQSRGAVVIGEPGSGKTHLMMRLAQELLQINRLLFIRQPNNPDAVLYHIYTRILDSFVEQVPANGYTQLENLLAHSFVRIISTAQPSNLTQRGQNILSIVQANPLNLYSQLGAEGTATRREHWRRIEGRVSSWWMNQYGIAGFAPQILRGIIRFCSYADPRRRAIVSRWLAAQNLEPEAAELVDLPNWGEEISREEFSLQAISVFSRLSLLDEPLIIIFDQLEGLRYNEQTLRQFGFAITELFTHVPNSLIIFNLFPDRWQHFQTFFDRAFIDRVSQYQIRLHRPSNEQILGILNIKLASVNANLDTVLTTDQLDDILSFPSIRAILNRAAAYHAHFVSGAPFPPPVQPSITVTQTNHSDITSFDQRLLNLEQSVAKIMQVFDAIATAWTTNVTHEPSAAIANPNNGQNSDRALSLSHPVQLSEQDEIRGYFTRHRELFETTYHQPKIITDNDDLGKLLTITQAFQSVSQIEIDQLRLGRRVLPEHLVIHRSEQRFAIGFLGDSGAAFTSRIGNWNELVLNHLNIQFKLFRDIRHGEISGSVGRQHIASLDNAPNGKFEWLHQSDRVTFELIYRLISDIQNHEVEFSLRTAIDVIISEYPHYWLIQVLS